mmetsp:Transcript_8192/g.11406  ORF Transcript_8192/g.11406 Transcript_8192/m.11406 type:complete len:861 (+) Transcript_8192:313-2895(+)
MMGGVLTNQRSNKEKEQVEKNIRGRQEDKIANQEVSNAGGSQEISRPSTQELFRRAVAQSKIDGDPWARYRLHELPAERVRRHRYDVSMKEWVIDETLVKVERTAFDRGAMRRCFRMKKVSQQPNRASIHPLNWRKANNYIGKQYLDPETSRHDGGKAAIMLDVQLQLCAAVFTDSFNTKLRPPKRVKIIDCFAIEFYDRTPVEYMLVERFISGKDEYGRGFVKHNSNIGYVDDDEKRLTPQVLSAATFWLSRGRAMVTDVQGVADLYTDPQLHTKAQSFGTGDLGRRGMAFFFQSYDGNRNPLFAVLGVPVFELSPSEIRRASNAAKGRAAARRTEASSDSDWGHYNSDSSHRLETATTMRRMRRAMLRRSETGDDDRESSETVRRVEAVLIDVKMIADEAMLSLEAMLERHSNDENGLIHEIVDLTSEARSNQDMSKAPVAENFDIAEILAEYMVWSHRFESSSIPADSGSSAASAFYSGIRRSSDSSRIIGAGPSKSHTQSSLDDTFPPGVAGVPIGGHSLRRPRLKTWRSLDERPVSTPIASWRLSGTSTDASFRSCHTPETRLKYPDVNEYYHQSKPRAILPDEKVEPELRLALAECHAALAELECEGRFTDWNADSGSALFHCAKATALGSAVAAHALARWHLGKAPGSLCPRDALAGQTPRDLTEAGKLLVLAALRGDPPAAAALAHALAEGALGLPKHRPLARAFYEAALQAAKDPDDTQKRFIFNTQVGDIIEADYACNGFHYDARVRAVHEDGSADVVYLEDDELESHVPWTRLRTKRNTPMVVIPPGQAGTCLPPKFALLAALSVVSPDASIAAEYLQRAAHSAMQFRAPALAHAYLNQAKSISSNRTN